MREVPATIAAMLEARAATLAQCVALELRDGTVIGMSDHDNELVVALPGLGAVTLNPGAGIRLSDIELAVSLDAGTAEFTCPLGPFIGRTEVVGRRFNHAKVWVFDADWSADVPDYVEIMKGLVAEARVAEGVAVFEVRDNNDYWNVTIGSILTPRCRADFADALCGATPVSVAGTVTAVTSSLVFQTSVTAYADDYFRFGECQFTSGELGSVWPIEIMSFNGTTGEVELYAPAPQAPEIGDGLILRTGCSRLKESDDPAIPTCFTHDNIPRFRGFDQVPGTDTYVKFAVPGGG